MCAWAHLAHFVNMQMGLEFSTYSNELMSSKKSTKFHDCQQLLASEDRHCYMQFVITAIALWR